MNEFVTTIDNNTFGGDIFFSVNDLFVFCFGSMRMLTSNTAIQSSPIQSTSPNHLCDELTKVTYPCNDEIGETFSMWISIYFYLRENMV